LEALGAQRAPQPAPAAATTRSSGEIAAAPSAGSGPAPTAIPEVTAAAVSSPTEPIPVATDLPVGASSAFPSPPAAPAAQGAEIAGATSAASPEGGPTLAPPTAGPAPAVAPPAAAAPAVPAPRVLFEDRFGDGPQLWPNDPQGSARYEGSAYRLLAREPGQFVAVAAPFRQPLRDAIVTASFTKVGGPPGGVYGLFVRDSGPAPRDGANQVGNFYVLGVDDRGQYGVWRREGSRWVDIVPLTSSEAVRPGGATNELTAHALDDRLSLTVNGVEVATVLGTEPRPGGLGVYIAGDLNEVQLNRFEVQPATASAGAAPAALTREAEVAGAVDVRAVETRSGTTRAPAGFTAAFLREAPTTSAPALAALPNGTGLEVLSDSATGDGFTWLRVRTGDGALGWMVSTAVAI